MSVHPRQDLDWLLNELAAAQAAPAKADLLRRSRELLAEERAVHDAKPESAERDEDLRIAWWLRAGLDGPARTPPEVAAYLTGLAELLEQGPRRWADAPTTLYPGVDTPSGQPRATAKPPGTADLQCGNCGRLIRWYEPPVWQHVKPDGTAGSQWCQPASQRPSQADPKDTRHG